ncbi:MAG: response regulator [Pseudomonadales bacterium]|nr:response regulator [Pseudomonadales bacterium]
MLEKAPAASSKTFIEINQVQHINSLFEFIYFWQPTFATDDGQAALNSFLQASTQSQWPPFSDYQGHILSLDHLWLALRLKNSGPKTQTIYYENTLMPLPNSDFIIAHGHNILLQTKFGLRHKDDTAFANSRTYIIAITIPAGAERIILLRNEGMTFEGLSSSRFLSQQEVLFRSDPIAAQIWFFSGISLILMILCLIFYYYSREKYNLLFALILINSAFLQIYYNGLTPDFMTPGNATWQERTLYIHTSMGFVFMLLFGNMYLNIQQFSISFHRFYLSTAALLFINIIPLLFLPFITALKLLVITSCLAIVALLSQLPLAFYQWYRGHHSGRDFSIIWSVYLFLSLLFYIFLNSNSQIFSASQYVIFTQFSLNLVAILLFLSIFNNVEETKDQRHVAVAESHAKNDFLAKMSHEIRTPMSGVLGMSELMAETKLNEQQKHYNDMIYKSGRHLLSVINDVLDYSKISAGKLELENIEFNITRLAKDVMGLFSIMARDKSLDLVCRVAPTIPLHWHGDENRIRQIIINLLGNALKFTHSGEILINIDFKDNDLPYDKKSRKSDLPTHLLCISVKDTGIGIKEELQHRIFDDFSQADSSTSRTYGGTGLGLSICKQLVELMQGSITLTSRLGLGSTFTFQLPLNPNLDDIYQTPAVLNQLSLLLVDDNESYRKIVVERLQGSNIQLQLAENAKEALEAIQEKRISKTDFDIISLDIDMPDMDGITLAQQIKEQDLSKAALLLLSSVRTIPAVQEYSQWGVNYAAQKPVLASELIPLFAHTLGLQQGKTIDEEKAIFKPQISSRHILVAEDNDVNFQVISILLKKQKHRVQRAQNGLQAMELFKANNLQNNPSSAFDIILMDCEMPQMDGYQAAEALRELEKQYRLQPIPIIALTAHAVKEHLNKCLMSGMDEVITKPFNQQQITQLFIRLFHS